MPDIKVRSLSVGYLSSRNEPHVIVRDVSADVCPGSLVCLLGANGTGKSTLLRTIAGLQSSLAGRVYIDGEDIRSFDRRQLARTLSLVLTERVSTGMMSAYSLVSLGRYPYTDWSGKLSERDHEIIRRSLEMVGVRNLADRQVNELSDGERQKMMIARSLAQQTPVMILDEITAFLDLPRRVEIMQILRTLARSEGKAILLSTHDLDLALRSADRIWLLSKDGEFRSGCPEDLVLSGAMQAAFESEGVDFDLAAGTFRVHHPCFGQVVLNAEGNERLWTARALEREGFAIVQAPRGALANSATISIEVRRTGARTVWRVSSRDLVVEHDCLEEVVACIRQRVGTSRSALSKKTGPASGGSEPVSR